MNSKILLLAVTLAALSSCTTSYKTGQTPDDVYYSPARPEEEYVQKETKEDDRQYRNNDEYYDDQYVRMKVRNRNRWSDLDDPYYYSSRYNYSSYNCSCFNNPWTPSSYWNNHYNPYYQSYIIVNPKTNVSYSGPRNFNLNSYNNNALTNSNYSNPKNSGSGNGSSNNNTYSAPRNGNSNNNSNSGNILRDVFKGNNNNNSSGSNSNNNNSSSTNSSGSSGSSSGGSTPAPVRRF